MKVVWTHRAKARLHPIHHYIAKDQPLNADRVVDRLTSRVTQLAEHPRSGRIVEGYRREDLRELIEAPYRIIYRSGSSASTS
ncbi:MAG: type II toxin-antitoxin system RelE/ParE family toxin [Proteobacteria bacterium]|nr:type II toxin-antitoxin system RelE/ParE family toxin [Pseudomonadota bacterium]